MRYLFHNIVQYLIRISEIVPQQKASDDEQDKADKFHEYMLEELRHNVAVLQDIGARKSQYMQFYLTAVSVIVGGGAILISTLDRLDRIAFVGLIALFIGYIGTQTVLQNAVLQDFELRQRALRAGLISYFRELDPLGLEKSGLQALLMNLLQPHYFKEFSRRPWKQFPMLGTFAVFHCSIVAVGVGTFVGAILERICLSFALQDWFLVLFPVFTSEIAFHIYLYIVNKEIRKHQIQARDYTLAVLKNVQTE